MFTLRVRQAARSLKATLALSLLAFVALSITPPPASAQDVMQAGEQEVVGGPGSANYPLAARFAPYKINDLLYDTSVNPRWIEDGDRFWYDWDTGAGTFYYIVDPARRAPSRRSSTTTGSPRS